MGCRIDGVSVECGGGIPAAGHSKAPLGRFLDGRLFRTHRDCACGEFGYARPHPRPGLAMMRYHCPSNRTGRIVGNRCNQSGFAPGHKSSFAFGRKTTQSSSHRRTAHTTRASSRISRAGFRAIDHRGQHACPSIQKRVHLGKAPMQQVTAPSLPNRATGPTSLLEPHISSAVDLGHIPPLSKSTVLADSAGFLGNADLLQNKRAPRTEADSALR